MGGVDKVEASELLRRHVLPLRELSYEDRFLDTVKHSRWGESGTA